MLAIRIAADRHASAGGIAEAVHRAVVERDERSNTRMRTMIRAIRSAVEDREQALGTWPTR